MREREERERERERERALMLERRGRIIINITVI